MDSVKKLVKDGRIRILEHCPAGNMYYDREGSRRQVFSLCISPEDGVDLPSLSKALDDTGNRFRIARKGLLQIGTEYYFIENALPHRIQPLQPANEIGGIKNGFHELDVSADEQTIMISADHSLMDGVSLLRLTDYLIYRYRIYTGSFEAGTYVDPPESLSEDSDIFLLPDKGSWLPPAGMSGDPWLPPYERPQPPCQLEFVTPAKPVFSLCRRHSSSPVVLMALLLYEVFERLFSEVKDACFTINIPIDYRKSLGIDQTMKNASLPFLVQINGDEWKDMTFGEKAGRIRKQLLLHLDERYGRGWIRFLKSVSAAKDRRRDRDGTHEGSGEVMFLSYLRSPYPKLYDRMKLSFTGVSGSVMNDFTMMEYGNHFHLWIRPVSHGNFLPAMKEVFLEHGISMTCSRQKVLLKYSMPPVIKEEDLAPIIFFFVNPLSGHVNPMLSLIRAFIDTGCQVRVYTGNGVREAVEEAGAVCIACDSFYESLKSPEYVAYGFPRMLELAESLDEMVGRDSKTLHPLCAVVDSQSVWGRLLAEKYGIPVILSSATPVMNLFTIAEDWLDYFKKIEPWDGQIEDLLKMLEKRGFPGHTLLSLLCPGNNTDVVTYIPECLQGQIKTFNRERMYFTGRSRYLKRREAPDPASEGQRPFIYVTMGTFSSRSPAFFKSCIEALKDIDADVLIAIWKYLKVERFLPLPDNITLVAEVDQEAVLRRADLALFHAGINTISDCLMLGVPMVLYPQDADQFGNAKRVSELGAGIMISENDPDVIKGAVEKALADSHYRIKTGLLGEKMREAGGAEGAVKWIMGRLNEGRTLDG